MSRSPVPGSSAIPAPVQDILPDRTLVAGALICGYAVIIGFTDNYVRVIASDIGLWQFHTMRTLMALALLALAVPLFKMRLRPVRPVAVAARSAIHGLAILIYFGALAFLPVAIVAAGMFTAPIFVLLITRFAFGHAIARIQMVAVFVGFLGVLMVLGPEAMAGASLAAVFPAVAGAFYALGNIATRQWCAEESAETLVAGFFIGLGVFGMVGMGVLTLWPVDVPLGAAGFMLRGFAVPSPEVLGWTFAQAAGSLVGVLMMIRAYQMIDASRASVIEYVVLPASALWGLAIWGDRLSLPALAGMGFIVTAGVLIAARARRAA